MNWTLIIPSFLLFLMAAASTTAQDTLVFENQWKYPVKVEEERPREVIYRRADLTNSPLYIIEKRFISQVEYQNPDEGKARFRAYPENPRKLDVWVTTLDSLETTKGLLLHLDDTTLILRQKAGLLAGSGGAKTELGLAFPYQDVYKIEVRQRDKIRRYATWGAISGFVAGTLGGVIFFKDNPPCDSSVLDGVPCDSSLGSPFTKWEKSLLLGLGSAGGGGLAGGIMGSVRLTFLIGGKKDTFNQAIPRLQRQQQRQ